MVCTHNPSLRLISTRRIRRSESIFSSISMRSDDNYEVYHHCARLLTKKDRFAATNSSRGNQPLGEQNLVGLFSV